MGITCANVELRRRWCTLPIRNGPLHTSKHGYQNVVKISHFRIESTSIISDCQSLVREPTPGCKVCCVESNCPKNKKVTFRSFKSFSINLFLYIWFGITCFRYMSYHTSHHSYKHVAFAAALFKRNDKISQYVTGFGKPIIPVLATRGNMSYLFYPEKRHSCMTGQQNDCIPKQYDYVLRTEWLFNGKLSQIDWLHVHQSLYILLSSSFALNALMFAFMLIPFLHSSNLCPFL